MKNVLMTLFFLSGLAATQLAAQTCAPCPPECAKICKDKKSCEKACKDLVAAGKCTPAQAEACKAAVASCNTTGSAQAVSCKPADAVQTASCAPADKRAQRVQAADTKGVQAADTKEQSKQKDTKLVVVKG